MMEIYVSKHFRSNFLYALQFIEQWKHFMDLLPLQQDCLEKTKVFLQFLTPKKREILSEMSFGKTFSNFLQLCKYIANTIYACAFLKLTDQTQFQIFSVHHNSFCYCVNSMVTMTHI